MTRSFPKELFTPFKDPEQEFRSSRKHFKALREEVAETMAETMEQYMSKTRTDYGSGVARPKIEEKDNFELKGQFLKELPSIQAQLNNLGREIKKVNEKVYVAQIGCEQCKGPHYTKDCPLKDEEKTLKEAYYTQFGTPFQGGGYKVTALGFYQTNNANPSYQERRQSMEYTLSKFMSELGKRHKENFDQRNLSFNGCCHKEPRSID
uniref:Eukaryotic translation initiation factor 3 subunit G N-terminal domain-containing protein n=1 Tax=Tanacetum cinerariifolium TaxID=118510 RepID=A0A6L2MXG4_TANCI|nr:hypothetical protein [Tanacetum cinerariifolium]